MVIKNLNFKCPSCEASLKIKIMQGGFVINGVLWSWLHCKKNT